MSIETRGGIVIGSGAGPGIGVPDGIRIGTGAVFAPYPPPSGYAWAYVAENGVTVTESGSPVVELVRIN